jgi:hypothetical protein
MNEEQLLEKGFKKEENRQMGMSQTEFVFEKNNVKIVLTQLTHKFELTIIDRFGDEVNLSTAQVDTIDKVEVLVKAVLN